MKKSSVSILTITNLDQIELLKILAESLKIQSYNNIKEWIILDTSDNNVNLLEDIKFKIEYINVQNMKTIGEIKNYANNKASGDIIIWTSVNDYQLPSKINTIVEKLSNSEKLLVASQNIYLYNKNNKLIKKSINNNTLLPDTLAYKKEYCQTHFFDDSNDNYILKFTNNNCEPFEIILPENSIINFIDNDKSFIKNIKFEILEEKSINYLFDTTIYNQINSLIIIENDKYLPYDIVYLTGANGIEWEPSDMKLGGSEQAVVNLSNEWVKNGYNVIVYGNFKQDYNYNNVYYSNWLNLDTTKKIKNLIVWRTQGIILLMNFNYLADNIIVDFHDNFSYTLAHLDRTNLLKSLEKVNKYAFKSEYHLFCFEEFMGRKLLESEYVIILNGLRIEEFKNNKILNNNKELERNPFRFCYCSSYDRGLEYILENIWPYIYNAEPKAEFHIYYGMDYIFDQNFKNKLQLLMSQPGVMDHGRQPMDMIIREKYLSTFQLYLSDSIAEIDCISIRESLITGCIPIISKFGVFANRHGIQYNLDPNNKPLCQAIAYNIIKEMNDEEYIVLARDQLMTSLTIVSWEIVAESWIKLFHTSQNLYQT